MEKAAASAPRENHAERSYEDLRELIVRGQLAPGSRVMAADLAKHVSVSRRTVFVALHRLEKDGLLERLGGSYARWQVPPLTIEGFRDTLEVIAALEGLAGRRLAALDAEKRFALAARMRDLNARFLKAGERETPDGLAAGDLDHQFHDLTTCEAGPQIRATLDGYRPRMERYVQSYMGYLVMDLKASADEHESIIQAVEDGDPDDIEKRIRANRVQAAERYAEVIGRVGERGKW